MAFGGGGECGCNGGGNGGGTFVTGGGDTGAGFVVVSQLKILQLTFRDKNLWHSTADLWFSLSLKQFVPSSIFGNSKHVGASAEKKL